MAIAQAHPEYLVVVASRTDKENAATRINQKLQQKNVKFIALDLSSLANVRNFAASWVSSDNPPIQSLVLNAGVQYPYELIKTVDDLEAMFGINHGARIVLISSGMHDPAQKTGGADDKYEGAEKLAFPTGGKESFPGRGRYAHSKLANVLWTYALHRHLKQQVLERGITVTAMCPGFMPGTGLGRGLNKIEIFMWYYVFPRIIPLLRYFFVSNVHTAEESGKALARLAVGEDVEGVSGKYFEGQKEIKSSKDSYDEKKQEDLWAWAVNFPSRGDANELARFEQLKS
ncbi:hypothetical protein AB5N19_01405 [Seiridium cardinale]